MLSINMCTSSNKKQTHQKSFQLSLMSYHDSSEMGVGGGGVQRSSESKKMPPILNLPFRASQCRWKDTFFCVCTICGHFCLLEKMCHLTQR